MQICEPVSVMEVNDYSTEKLIQMITFKEYWIMNQALLTDILPIETPNASDGPYPIKFKVFTPKLPLNNIDYS